MFICTQHKSVAYVCTENTRLFQKLAERTHGRTAGAHVHCVTCPSTPPDYSKNKYIVAKKTKTKLVMMVHTFNPRTKETEAGRSL